MATLKFNMANVNIPSVYNTIDSYSHCFDIEDTKIAYLEIGKKYYTIKNNKPMAFKATALVFYLKSANYIVSYADGTNDMLSANLICEPSDFGYSKYYVVFENKDDLETFMDNKDRNLLYCEKVPISLYIGLYNCDLRPKYFSDSRTTLVGKVGYYVSKDLSIKTNMFAFNFLWIDKDGVHYELLNRQRYNPSGIYELYGTEEECLKSKQIIDFNDEDKEQEYVTINMHFTIRKGCEQEIIQGLINQNWSQDEHNKMDFYKKNK